MKIWNTNPLFFLIKNVAFIEGLTQNGVASHRFG